MLSPSSKPQRISGRGCLSGLGIPVYANDRDLHSRRPVCMKLEALESVIAPKLRTGRFKATDKLIEMLKAAPNMRSKKTAK